jgi:hypothetical protein
VLFERRARLKNKSRCIQHLVNLLFNAVASTSSYFLEKG